MTDTTVELSSQIASTGIADMLAVARSIREGMTPREAAELAQDHDVDIGRIIEIGILPRRTWSHAEKTGYVSPANVQRLVRYLRAVSSARDVFGAERADEWLFRPTAKLDGEAPVSLLDTDDGARAVETLLGRIAHGIGV